MDLTASRTTKKTSARFHLQEAIQQEVKNQVATYNAEIERANANSKRKLLFADSHKNVSYERIERYNTQKAIMSLGSTIS